MDARLSEIDRRLGEIQAELATPEPGAPDPPGSVFPAGGRSGPLEEVLLRAPRQPRGADDGLAQRIAELAELQADLLGSLREVLGAFERGLGAAARSSDGELTVSAGPFRSLEELRAFELALTGLPGVRAAAVRGYEGTDRAVIDVQLEQ